MEKEDGVDSLILLVGSNPLPNYLAAVALKPSTVYLLHSKETKGPKDRLHAGLSAHFGLGTTIDGDAYVDDPFSADAVADKVRDLIDNGRSAHLHYTGGTKVMSAHALRAFYDTGGQPGRSSYLDEANRCLRFDDGSSRDLTDRGVTLTLDRILQLHGVKPTLRTSIEGGPTNADLLEICGKVAADPVLAKVLYNKSVELKKNNRKPDKALSYAFDAAAVSLNLSVARIPSEAGWTSDRFKAWWRFLGGEWLEDWLRLKIDELKVPGVTDENITVGVTCTRAGTNRDFEVDVAVLRGQRAYIASCTTDASLGLCKSKAFEIAARSRQMGGDLARSALVCLLHGEDNKGKFVDQLRADVADVWGSSNSTRIFGLEDVRTWSGHCGSPNLDSLREWFES